jgi:hypothetical protein
MTPETRETLFEIATENAEALYDEYGGAEGLWVTKDDLPSDPCEFRQSELEEVFSPQRLEEILDGRPVTGAELRPLREVRLESILSGDCDADALPGYCLAEVTDEDGDTGIALIFCKGHSFSGLIIWVAEIFDTREAMQAYLEENGWTSWP